MALFFADLVREACWATGGGGLTLGGALPGHRTFAAAVPAGARFHYAVCGVTHPQEWETGEGEIVAGALVRDPIASSDDGAAVAFSAGLKTVALTVSADWFAARDGGVTTIPDVAGLSDALADKAPVAHAHSFGSLTGKPATLAGYGIADGQPLDGNLTAIAALSTTTFGRGVLTLADAAALRAAAGTSATGADTNYAFRANNLADLASAATARVNLGLGSIATQAATSVSISGGAISGLSSLSVSGPVATGANIVATLANGAYALAGDAPGGNVRLYPFVDAGTGSQLIAFSAGYAGYGKLTIDAQGVRLLYGGVARVETTSDGVAISGALSIGGSQVMTTRRTGWTAASGTASRATFDTASVTTQALAERVKALIDDLTTHGLIGA